MDWDIQSGDKVEEIVSIGCISHILGVNYQAVDKITDQTDHHTSSQHHKHRANYWVPPGDIVARVLEIEQRVNRSSEGNHNRNGPREKILANCQRKCHLRSGLVTNPLKHDQPKQDYHKVVEACLYRDNHKRERHWLDEINRGHYIIVVEGRESYQEKICLFEDKIIEIDEPSITFSE